MNNDIFAVIDSKEKAYWLGFIFADGYIGKDRNKLQVILSVVDEKHLDKFILFTEEALNRKRYYGPYKTSGKQVHFYVISEKIINDLKNIGCVNKKSKIIRLPSFSNEELNIAFLLGYYDGDGSGLMLTCGSKDFLEDIKIKYNLSYKVSKTNNKYETYRMWIGKNLYIKMINNFSFSLDRKRNLFEPKYKLTRHNLFKVKKTKITASIEELR